MPAPAGSTLSSDRAPAQLAAPEEGDPSLSVVAERYARDQAALAPEPTAPSLSAGPTKLDSLEAELCEIQTILSLSRAREEAAVGALLVSASVAGGASENLQARPASLAAVDALLVGRGVARFSFGRQRIY